MKLSFEVPKIDRSLVREQIRSRLQSWIVEGALRPGEVLYDKEFAAAFGVSRMPVREALRTLEDQGLVETSLNRWTRVAPLGIGQARKLYSVVATLDDLALRSGFDHLSETEFRILHSGEADLRTALAKNDLIAAARADDVFHGVWLKLAANSQLERSLTECRMKLARIEIAYFRSRPDLRQSLDEHQRIVEALEAGDLTWSLAELSRHWRASIERCLAHVHLFKTQI